MALIRKLDNVSRNSRVHGETYSTYNILTSGGNHEHSRDNGFACSNETSFS